MINCNKNDNDNGKIDHIDKKYIDQDVDIETNIENILCLGKILLSMLVILLSILTVMRHLICGNNLNWLVNLNLIYETLWTSVRSGLLISMLGKLSWFCLTDLITMVLLMWKWMGLFFDEKSSFKMLGSTFSSKLDWGSYIISIAKIFSKKIGAPIRSMKSLSSEVALCLYKSTYAHGWNTVSTSGLAPLVATWNC